MLEEMLVTCDASVGFSTTWPRIHVTLLWLSEDEPKDEPHSFAAYIF